MRRPLVNDPLVLASFDELDILMRWLGDRRRRHPRQTALLVGGWAVYMYNPYFGSYDIDLVLSSKARSSAEHFLISKRGFQRDVNPYQGSKGVVLDSHPGKIHIDTAAVGGSDDFEGVRATLEMSSIAREFILFDAGDITVPIPERGRLLLTKLKAAWDRSWRLQHGTSREPNRERNKLEKDFADILALVDPTAGGRELDFIALGASLEQYGFLQGILDRAGRDPGGIRFYGRLSREEAGVAVGELLRLTRR